MKRNNLDEIIEKAVKVFRELACSGGKKTILTGEGLTRTELRILERKGLVRKMTIYGTRKYKDITPTIGYAWEWVGASEQ